MPENIVKSYLFTISNTSSNKSLLHYYSILHIQGISKFNSPQIDPDSPSIVCCQWTNWYMVGSYFVCHRLMPHYFIKRTQTFNYAQTHKNFNLSWSQKEPPERPLCSIHLLLPLSLPSPLSTLSSLLAIALCAIHCQQTNAKGSWWMRRSHATCGGGGFRLQDILWRIMRTN